MAAIAIISGLGSLDIFTSEPLNSCFSNQFLQKRQVAMLYEASALNVVLQNKLIQKAGLICKSLKENARGHSLKSHR